MADDMDVDEVPKTKERKEKDSGKARFEVKKVNTLEFVSKPGTWFFISVLFNYIVECCVPLGLGWGFLFVDCMGRAH